jgi:hypothetical protein
VNKTVEPSKGNTYLFLLMALLVITFWLAGNRHSNRRWKNIIGPLMILFVPVKFPE